MTLAPRRHAPSSRLLAPLPALTLALTGCVTLGGGVNTAGLRADTPLVQVNLMALPVLQRSSVLPSERALMNPGAQPPAVAEDLVTRRHCSALALDYTGEDLLLAPADRAAIEAAYAQGPALEQRRRVWNFEMERAQAQDRFLNGPRLNRQGQPDVPVGPRPTGTGQSPAARPTAGGLLGALLPQRAPTAPPALAPNTPGLAETRGQLAHNMAVLKLQAAEIEAGEAAYTGALTQALARSAAAWQALPPASVTPARLNAFDHFRTYQVAYCIAKRGRLDATNQARLDRVNADFDPFSQRVVAAQRPQLLQRLAAVQSTFDLDFWLREAFPTPTVQRASLADPEFSTALARTRQTLEEREARAREAALRAAAAERERQAQARRNEFLANARRNVAPTADQVAVLATDSSAEGTNAATRYTIRRTSDTTYETLVSFFGQSYITNAFVMRVEKLSCTPEKARQRCSFTSVIEWTAYNPGGAPDPVVSRSRDDTRVFYWTDKGLQVEGEIKTSFLETVSTGRSGGSSSSSSGGRREQTISDMYIQRDQDNRQRYYDYQTRTQSREQYNPGRQY